ncbi:hypothetical protein G436_0542 [Leptospira interrogans serovar Hardjo str. Norma]|uniref:Uncharacterized protein n=1 Tax=Leptospira interrogans serovar Hardjo str. Norma TaxID=1279460 RepID=A0A0M3TKQ4_LEPIR|nr:hypothetical protein G436_0542 [Leptospira interrogans serovar Hardjo str. Norma]EKO94987.1 hypothetical protein LEP1GSC057_0539 [Leptospira interrogans str. Brem 329]
MVSLDYYMGDLFLNKASPNFHKTLCKPQLSRPYSLELNEHQKK